MKTLVIALLLVLSVNQANAGAPLNYNDEAEASAALLFLDLYNKGIAGGKTGVCIDFQKDINGKPQYKAAFDTSAFLTGSSELKEGSFDFNKFNELINTVSKVQTKDKNNKVNVYVDGYADGQHYVSSSNYDVNTSISKNEKLSYNRAKVIAEIIDNNPNVSVGEKNIRGHASPFWENKYPGKNDGVNCPNRRKVVVTFDQPTPQIASEINGNFFRAPESLQSKMNGIIVSEFHQNISNAQKALNISYVKHPSRASVENIYAELMKNKKLNAKCDLPPFKQVTLAMIEYYINSSKEYLVAEKNILIQEYLHNTDFDISSFKNIEGAQSALESACLIPSKATEQALEKSVQSYAVSGASFLTKSGLKTINGSVNVGFDVNSLQPQMITQGPNKGKKLRGFYCKACGSGVFFYEDPEHHGQFKTEYTDRIVQSGNMDKVQSKFVNNLNQLADADPLSVGAMLKPRMFVVKNCKDCKCDHDALIRANDSSVIKFDPLSGSAVSAEISASEFDQVCIIRPPVHHSCGTDPNKNNGADQVKFLEQLSYESSIQNLKFVAPNISELINNVGNSCPADLKLLTAEQKIANVKCSSDRLKQLPSEDERDDCAGFDTKIAK